MIVDSPPAPADVRMGLAPGVERIAFAGSVQISEPTPNNKVRMIYNKHDISESPSPLAQFRGELVDSIDKAGELKRWLGERRDVLGVDTESGGLKPERHRLRMVQFGDLNTGWAVPWERWGGVAEEVLRTYEGPLVLHNSSFDMRFLQTKIPTWKAPWHRIHDTMTLAHLNDPTRPKGLKPLAARLVDVRAVSGQRLLDDIMQRNNWTWDTVPLDHPYYWIYSSMDPVLTCHIYDQLMPKVENQGMMEAYDLEMAVVRICSEMMLKGVRVDVPYCTTKNAELREWVIKARQWLDAEWGIANATSNQQVLKVLLAEGIELTKTTKGGQLSLDQEVLSSLDHPVAHMVLKIRKAEKICSSYLENFAEMVDLQGIVHCNINTMGARTGRMSVTDPALQTLHRGDPTVRDVFIPREGNVLVTCDADQIEARLAAHFAQDQGLIDTFLSDDDFFCGVASEIFQEPIEKGDPRRQLTKNTVYGCLPLDTEIYLENKGWSHYHDIREGDYTLGLNEETQCIEWTRIIQTHYYDSAPLVYLTMDPGIAIRCTPNHRWYIAHIWHRPIDNKTPTLIEHPEFKETSDLKETDCLITSARLSPSLWGKAVQFALDGIPFIAKNSVSSSIREFPRVTPYKHQLPVWCVTTELGSWVMRQNGHALITGNSIYGAGVEKMAQTAGVTFQQMEPVKHAFDSRFPGLKNLMQQVTRVAHQRLLDEGSAYVRTPLGRILPVTDEKEYKLVNYLIQGHAAEILKQGLVDLDAAGVGEYLILPVHDEVILDVPRSEAEDVQTLVEQTLTDTSTYAVPLSWSADILTQRWGEKYRRGG